jgi:hypothetical protein
MKPQKQIPVVQVLKNGSVNLKKGGKLIAYIAPEIFTEGWAKNALSDRLKDSRFQVIIPLATGGRVGLQTTVKASPNGLRFRFVLTPLETVKVIHIRLVINLPYNDWQESPYRLGSNTGCIPVKAPANNRLAEAFSASLSLGPSPVHKGLMMRLSPPKLHTVLQDNRQWTPFLHAFVTRNEKSDPAWKWTVGRKKVYGFSLSFPNNK